LNKTTARRRSGKTFYSNRAGFLIILPNLRKSRKTGRSCKKEGSPADNRLILPAMQASIARYRIWAHIATWTLLYLFWVTVLQNRSLTFSRTLTVQFCYLAFIAANYYFDLYFTIPRFLYRRRYFLFGLSVIGGILVGSFLRTLLALYMTTHVFQPGGRTPDFQPVFLNSLLNIAFWTIVILAVHLVIEKIRFRKYIDTIEKEKTKNELDFLKAQFNPHFLFNSINSIYGHIDKTNPTARNMLLTFSEMLRYQLYECNVDSISIDKEIHYMRNYVALQQIRKEEDLVVRMSVSKEIKGFNIAPLLFIGFIENAFKYVSTAADENKVEISLDKKEENVVSFRVFNTKERNTGNAIKDSGIGIANVRRRLELLYPGRHDLQITDAEKTYEVNLEIQLT
jgi:two-component system LytT family sensor kinase